MTNDDQKKTVRRLLEEGYNRGDTAVVDELVSDSFELHGGPPGLGAGRDALKNLFVWLRGAFPDLTVTIGQQLTEDYKVGTDLTLRGTQAGQLFMFPPSDREMSLHGMHLTHLDADGKIRGHQYADSFVRALQQLELIPAPDQPIINQGESPEDWSKYGLTGTLEENKTLIHRLLDEGWNKGDVSVCAEIVAVDAIDHNPFPGEPPGREGIVEMLQLVHDAAPDYQESVGAIIAEGDKVMAVRECSATPVKPYGGIPVTGATFSMTGIAMFRIAGGQVVERWGEFDILDVLRQLILPDLNISMPLAPSAA